MSFSTGCRKCEKCGKIYLISLFDRGLCAECEKAEQEPTIEAYKQVCKERDIAIEQLHELGYEFGQKIEPFDNAVNRQAVLEREQAIKILKRIIEVADTSDCGIKEIDGIDEEALNMAIKSLEQELNIVNLTQKEYSDLCIQLKGLGWKFVQKQEPASPCDLCKYNPPSSLDGKPCTMCPAEKGGK